MKKCFYQVFDRTDKNADGWGKCPECTYNKENKNCKGYIEVTIQDFYVKGG